MDMELTINPEVITTVEQSTLENMKGLFSDLRTVLEMCNANECDEATMVSLMDSVNEKINSVHETFDMMDMVFGCAFGSALDDDEDDSE